MQKIDPWSELKVKDYGHVFEEFGLKEVPKKISSSIKHYLCERGIIVAHRDFDKIARRIRQKKPFVNITGIACSGPYHLGHKVDIDLFKYFKSVGGKNYFAVSDIDAFLSRPDSKIPNLETAKKWAVKNVADLLALGLIEKDIYVQ